MQKLSIAALRINSKMTQEDVANALGITVLSYRNKENGLSEFKFSELLILSELFKCDISIFKHP
ncbi:MAG: helix-turn-helix transcriptional regulator [Erysipelotrichaceae bacterium]|nr:helix-turn-helix transcriptional regulator [Erysipelotrichaceae bacterium]